MTLQELLDLYIKKLDKSAFSSEIIQCEKERHVKWMLEEISSMANEPTINAIENPLNNGKISRWLGFVQGFFWVEGIYTIDEMREHVKKVLHA